MPLETEQISKEQYTTASFRRQRLAAYIAGQGRPSQRKLASVQQLPNDNCQKQQDYFFLAGGGGRVGTAHLLDCSVPVTSAIVKTSLPATYIPYSEREQLQGFLQTVTLVSACRALKLLRA